MGEKQKSGLSGVRPDDYTRAELKRIAKERGISQTKALEIIVWNYIYDENEKKREEKLSFESDVSLISQDLTNILSIIKGMARKSQETVIALENNAAQTEKNLQMEIDTLKKENENLIARNRELETSNDAFESIKTSLEGKIEGIRNQLSIRDEWLKSSKEENESINRVLESVNQGKIIAEEKCKSLEKENSEKQIKIESLEVVNANLNETLSKLETIKKAELDSNEARHKREVEDLKLEAKNKEKKVNATLLEYEKKIDGYNEKIEEIKEEHRENIKRIKEDAEVKVGVEKDMKIADLKLEIANIKEEFAKYREKNVSKK